MVIRFTTWGSVRGDCGHLHRTREEAKRCLARDRRSCRAQGGYSDRTLRRIEGDTLAAIRAALASYDVTRGPGIQDVE